MFLSGGFDSTHGVWIQPSSQPKHCYALDPSCVVSDIKETKAGGRPLFYFEMEWPSLSTSKEEVEEDADGDSGCVCVCVWIVCVFC